MSDYWEPWTPEVGQAVRARMSGECPHVPDLDGRVGRVIYVEPIGSTAKVYAADLTPIDVRGHRFAVNFPELNPHTYAYLAAIELEPIP